LYDGGLGDSAVDILEGGHGRDSIESGNFPASRDIVSCGAGRDRADADRKDIVSDDCERIWRDVGGAGA
jgi:hypothetical protein